MTRGDGVTIAHSTRIHCCARVFHRDRMSTHHSNRSTSTVVCCCRPPRRGTRMDLCYATIIPRTQCYCPISKCEMPLFRARCLANYSWLAFERFDISSRVPAFAVHSRPIRNGCGNRSLCRSTWCCRYRWISRSIDNNWLQSHRCRW